MASKKRIKVKTTAAGAIKELDQFLKSFGGNIRARVWTDIHYAVYVEFGTVHMKPRAMIRKSIPQIEVYFEQQWANLKTFPPTEKDVRKIFNDTIEYAKTIIVGNTPVKSGDLKASWQVQKARFYKGKKPD